MVGKRKQEIHLGIGVLYARRSGWMIDDCIHHWNAHWVAWVHT